MEWSSRRVTEEWQRWRRDEVAKLESPIDAMYLIHNGLFIESNRVERMVNNLEVGGSVHPVQLEFNAWAAFLAYHAEVEDRYMTAALVDVPAARDCEESHRTLEQRIEDVYTCFSEEIGRTSIISRTRRHLFGHVVMLRIAQSDHLEEEEQFVLPLIRERLSEEQQLEIIRHLLLDDEADDPRWPVDWVSQNLTPGERDLLAQLETSFS